MISAINANGDDGIFWTDLSNSYDRESRTTDLGSTDSMDWVVDYDWEDYGEMRNVQNPTSDWRPCKPRI